MSHVSREQVYRIWTQINGPVAKFRIDQIEKANKSPAGLSLHGQSRDISYAANPNRTGYSMSQRLEEQIELLTNAKSRYQGLSERIQDLIYESKRIVVNLADNELNHDYVEYLDEFNLSLIPAMAHVVERIEEELQSNLTSKIRYLEERSRN